MSTLIKLNDKALQDQIETYGEVLWTGIYKCDQCSEVSSVRSGDNHYCIDHYLEKVEK